MKTKLTTIFKKSANTPPIWACLLFALVISTNCWADVTAEWGAFGTSTTALPSNISSTIEGDVDITVAANFATQSLSLGGKQNNAYQINSTGNHIDISTSSGTISSVGIYIWCPSGVKVQFSSSSTYSTDNLTGSPFTLTSEDVQSNTTLQELTSSDIPSNAKSARIYIESDNWKSYLYYITVTVTNIVPCTKYTATFSPAGTETSGAAPSSISKCAELTFEIPNSGTLVKTGYDFVGWDDGSGADPYIQGDSYTMPEDGVTFTAVWTEHIVPAVTDLNSSLSDDDITLSWTNYNKFNMASVSYVDAALNNYTVANGALICNYTHGGGWTGPCLELTLPRSMDHVTSIDMQYTHTNSVSSSGGIITYLKSGVEDANGKWYDSSDDAHTYLTKTADPTDIQITPNAILWSTTSNAYSPNYHINIIGFACNLESASTGTFSIKDIYVNTSDNQTTLDEIKVIRKKGSAPASIGDGTQVYSGVLNTFTDEDLEDGSYYYAVYAREGSLYSAAVVEGPIQVGTPKADPELTASVNKGVIPTTGSALLTVSKANAYDGTLEYSVSPSGVINLNESTGEITAVAAGTATITVTAPATAAHYADNKSVTVTVLAAPETNLAITNVDGDNVTLSWNIPGIIDLTTASTENITAANYNSDFSTPVSSWTQDGEALDVTYTCNQWAMCGIAFPIDLDDLESLSVECKTNDNYYSGDPGSIILGAHAGAENVYYGGGKGLPQLNWASHSSTLTKKWYNNDFSGTLDNVDAVCVFINPNPAQENSHFYIRNLRYHSTGMTDIDHIVIMRTTSVAATDTVSGSKIYSGKRSHFVDTDSKAAGLYYYTLFAVYANGYFPVESKTFDNRTFTITYKDQNNADFSGDLADGSPASHKGSATTNLKKASKVGYAFGGWYTTPACTGDAINVLAADTYDADITLYARWIEMNLHTPGTYTTPVSEGGYGRALKHNANHDYEVYLVTFDEAGRECTKECADKVGELYAGPRSVIHDGYKMLTGTTQTAVQSSDGWLAVKAYKYEGDHASANSSSEFSQLNSTSGLGSSRSARLGQDHYVRIYVQGYEEFAFSGKDKELTEDGSHFVIRIDGIPQAYEYNTGEHIARFSMTANEPHLIEVTGSTSNTNNKFRGFSLQLPDVDRYTVSIAKNENSYGAVSAASIANVRTGSPVYINGNLVYIAGDTITATPTESNAQYTYAFNNWTVGGAAVPATITAATAITANFTRTAKEYTLTWDLDGGTVTTAGTGAAVDATGTPSTTVAYGEAITVPVVVKEGSEFRGWDVTPSAMMPAENTTYTAQWITPELIGENVVRLDANNTVSSYTSASDVDIDGDGVNDACMNLRNTYADWRVYIKQGKYNVTLEYGKPDYSLKAKILLVDPSNNDAETELQYYEVSNDVEPGKVGRIEIRGCDFSQITEDHMYIIRVKDTYTSCELRVRGIEFKPFEPVNYSKKIRLDSTNVFKSPGLLLLEGVHCINPKANGKAEWYAYLNPTKYNIYFRYGAREGAVNVTLNVIDPSNNEVLLTQQDSKSGSYKDLSTVSYMDVDLSNKVEEGKVYLIRMTDTYNGNTSKPCIAYIDFIPQITYTRSGLTVGKFGTICLPYPIADGDISGADMYEFQGWAPESNEVTLTSVTSMEAGHPYIYQATASTMNLRYYAEQDETPAGSHKGLIGSYDRVEIEKDANNYIVYNNRLVLVTTDEIYVGAYKAYISRSTAESEYEPISPAPGVRRITLKVEGEQVVTDLENVTDTQLNGKFVQNGQLIIIRDGVHYNVIGLKLQ